MPNRESISAAIELLTFITDPATPAESHTGRLVDIGTRDADTVEGRLDNMIDLSVGLATVAQWLMLEREKGSGVTPAESLQELARLNLEG